MKIGIFTIQTDRYPLSDHVYREAASGLRAFVENGGYVLAEARMGWNDDRGYASEVFPDLGCMTFWSKENEIKMRESIEFTVTDENHPAMQGLEKGSKLMGSLYVGP